MREPTLTQLRAHLAKVRDAENKTRLSAVLSLYFFHQDPQAASRLYHDAVHIGVYGNKVQTCISAQQAESSNDSVFIRPPPSAHTRHTMFLLK